LSIDNKCKQTSIVENYYAIAHNMFINIFKSKLGSNVFPLVVEAVT